MPTHQTHTLILPARNGWRWIAEGNRIYTKSRMTLALMVVCYWMLMLTVSNLVPAVGGLVTTICFPALSVGLMDVCRRIDRGEAVVTQTLFSGFSTNLRVLLSLGVIYIVIVLAIFGVTALFDGGRLFRVFFMGESLQTTAPNPLATWAALLLLLPVVMAYWYAPVLAAWHGHSAGKSLFFSLFACLRNWRAFFVYALSLFFLAVIFALFSGSISAIVPGTGRLVVMLLLTGFFALPVVYASFYVSYCDVFAVGDGSKDA